MKVHYINILLFALLLNILANNNNKQHTTPYHTHTNRSLCECDLYIPNYDNDPQMKEIMENFNKQTQQRFHEYDERMVENRKQCKDKCDKEIQKIILKDKLEKQMEEQLTTLETKIGTDDIPTCIFEKSMADKVEKGCLRCGYGLGGVLTSWEIFGYTGIYGWSNIATALAKEIGIKEGIKVSIKGVKEIYNLGSVPGVNFQRLVTVKNFDNINLLGQAVQGLSNEICVEGNAAYDNYFCLLANPNTAARFSQGIAQQARTVALEAGSKAKEVTGTKLLLVDTTTSNSSNVMIASGFTILVIVLVMIIIYLILRYRRKKKMKKKLQYIKLLEE
ncbi:rifin [Plasmodium reichenowi]|uniref:Rifin n=1 Tax=Plasmodium reichenowi TaxID=5854 RepID=A0A060RQJ1_PLARE|nr:rifin [Plasmodium reichenowi]